LSNGREKSASGTPEQIMSARRKTPVIEGEASDGSTMQTIISDRHLTRVGDRAGLAKTDYP
jgi:hypothetical protein